MTTYRLDVVLPESALNVYTIYGTGDAPARVPMAYQVPLPFGADVGGVNPMFFTFMAAARYDSWLSVGITEGDADGIGTIGINFEDWTDTQNLGINDGALFFMEPANGPAERATLVRRKPCALKCPFGVLSNLRMARVRTGSDHGCDRLGMVDEDQHAGAHPG